MEIESSFVLRGEIDRQTLTLLKTKNIVISSNIRILILIYFQTVPTLEEVEAKFSSILSPGGKFKPTECVQKQKVAFIVPCR